MNSTYRDLERSVLEIKTQLLRLCSLQSIHIGGDLSLAEVMTVLWKRYIRFDASDPRWEKRDRFILSKGHAASLLSLEHAMIGCYDVNEVMNGFAQDASRFSMHVSRKDNPFVEFSTGSLGHGLPVACGIAEALKMKGNNDSRVFVVMGDGEQSEGSIWEAVMNASFLKLGNLVAIIDFNKLQSDGNVLEMTGIGNLKEKYKAFGWETYEIDGHDVAQIVDTFDHLPDPASEKPIAVICNTVKGHGVSMMEDQVRWHAGKISEEQYKEFTDILIKQFKEKWEA